MWHHTDPTNVIFNDIAVRSNGYRVNTGNRWRTTATILPDVRSDCHCLPFREAIFDVIIFDPPHLQFGQKAEYTKSKFGSISRHGFLSLLIGGTREFRRVLKRDGLLFMKFTEVHMTIFGVQSIIEALGFVLLTKVLCNSKYHASQNKTAWLNFKLEE